MPDVAELGVCAETQGTFQSHSMKSLLKQRGSEEKTFVFFKVVTFYSF